MMDNSNDVLHLYIATLLEWHTILEAYRKSVDVFLKFAPFLHINIPEGRDPVNVRSVPIRRQFLAMMHYEFEECHWHISWFHPFWVQNSANFLPGDEFLHLISLIREFKRILLQQGLHGIKQHQYRNESTVDLERVRVVIEANVFLLASLLVDDFLSIREVVFVHNVGNSIGYFLQILIFV